MQDPEEHSDKKRLLDHQDVDPERHTKAQQWRLSPLSITALTLLPFALCLLTFSSTIKPLLSPGVDAAAPVEYCPTQDGEAITAPVPNIWRNLDLEEALSIRKWLHEPQRALNLTRGRASTDEDNIIQVIESFAPRKEDALAFVYEEGPKPEKYAHVVIQHGAWDVPVVRDYLVGPLPISSRSEMKQLREQYHEPDVPYHGRGIYTTADGRSVGQFLKRVMTPLKHITRDLFGAEANGEPDDTIVASGSAPLSYDGTWRRMWVPFKLNVPGSFLQPIDLYFYVDMSGKDPSKWSVLKVVYNHQVFGSIASFVSAYEAGELVRSPKPVLSSTDWATRTPKGKIRDLDHRVGPRQVSFDGPRFRADKEEQYITWMDWSFYLGFEHDMGLSFWNIAFKGEKLVYELRPQEAMAQYSGNDPRQASTVWLDRSFGMGKSVREQIVGYDCPVDALYLPATVHDMFGTSTRKNAICVFERDSGKPLTRHTGWMKDEMGGTKGFELVVRTISTVGNYDYLFDYTFQLDGSFEVRLSASGYVQGGVWDEDQKSYGHRLRETSMASLHDHVINYKIDFDVGGPANSLMAVALEMEDVEQPWFDDGDWGSVVHQQKLVRRFINSEDASRLDYARNGEGVYVVVNKNETNAWGSIRGYAVHPGNSPVHLTNLHAKRTEKNVEWAKHHLSVTQRRETERDSSSTWNMNLPGKPPVDFSRFFDGDSLDQEDLVMWINVGTHHFVRAEDSPHTLTNLATSSVLFSPWNYFDADVSMESRNSIVLNAAEPGQPWQVKGHKEPSYCLPQKQKPFEYNGLQQWEEDGREAKPSSVLEQRMEAEQYHGLHLTGEDL